LKKAVEDSNVFVSHFQESSLEQNKMLWEWMSWYNSSAILSISLCHRWPSNRAQPISCLDDPI